MDSPIPTSNKAASPIQRALDILSPCEEAPGLPREVFARSLPAPYVERMDADDVQRHYPFPCYALAVPEFLLLHGFARDDRLSATWRARDAVSSSGGFVVDARVFSNKAIALSFELPKAAVPAFRSALESAGVRLYDESTLELDAFCARRAVDDPGDVPGMLNIALIHGGPDEKTEVPSVPG